MDRYVRILIISVKNTGYLFFKRETMYYSYRKPLEQAGY